MLTKIDGLFFVGYDWRLGLMWICSCLFCRYLGRLALVIPLFRRDCFFFFFFFFFLCASVHVYGNCAGK